jgi:glyoxylase-like metal-dependent hydrolase (beta-lactamase superfamily II)
MLRPMSPVDPAAADPRTAPPAHPQAERAAEPPSAQPAEASEQTASEAGWDRSARAVQHGAGQGDGPLAGLTVLERGWLSSNNLLIHAAPGEEGALLVDSGHVNHAPQTVALVRHALRGQPLALLLNTHLHSDHCGGNAAVQQALAAPLAVPPGQAQALRDWDLPRLSWEATGQRMARCTPQQVRAAGEIVVAGAREWQLLAAPGHDPHSLMLFDARHGVLASADALWANGFGVVFPELEGEPAFDEVAATLDLIASLPVRVVVPGHGAPFTEVAAALARARRRLAGLKADPARHAGHALKVLIKYHLMEERSQPLPALLAWAAATPLLATLWQRFAPRGLADADAWVMQALEALAGSGALRREGEVVFDA